MNGDVEMVEVVNLKEENEKGKGSRHNAVTRVVKIPLTRSCMRCVKGNIEKANEKWREKTHPLIEV